MLHKTHIWLRAEVKPYEHRTPLTPHVCASLLAAGFEITVERSVVHNSLRCIPDEEYLKVGCSLVDPGTWVDAPGDAFIIGLKELPADYNKPLRHRHIYFAHCFKKQAGWAQLLRQFHEGKGLILDLEFLKDEKGRRVAAFGYMAGYCGAALGLLNWAHNILQPNTPLKPIKAYPNSSGLITLIKDQLSKVKDQGLGHPNVVVIGAMGRCGRGACDLLKEMGLNDSDLAQWDLAETKGGGPFPALLEYSILINCIYLSSKIAPFLTKEMVSAPESKLSVIVDVSCDPTSPYNPVPIYNTNTTFDSPSLTVDT
eukprot:Ihof_evm2s742 gene=Ihof_evmTU2s742